MRISRIRRLRGPAERSCKLPAPAIRAFFNSHCASGFDRACPLAQSVGSGSIRRGEIMKLTRPLKGIIPPVLTPLANRDQLDGSAFERLLNYLIEGGSSALFVLGSTGESPGLSDRLRREVIDRACTAVGRRVPLLVGITDTSFAESLHLAEYAAKAGAAALVLSPPYYFNL